MPFALAALVLLYMAMLLFGGGPWDEAILAALYAGLRPLLAEAASRVTGLGGAGILVPASLVVALIAWRVRRDWRAAGLFLVATLAGRLLVELQKGWTSRLRPEANEHLVAAQSYAFPSGHAANATIVWLGAALLLAEGRARPWAIAAAAAIAIAVGLTRPMLGVHWPSDVVAGWSFGLAWILLWLKFCGERPTGCLPASP
ncbi:MAG: phosphatase PAP2 family protein [Sphingomonas sp.]